MAFAHARLALLTVFFVGAAAAARPAVALPVLDVSGIGDLGYALDDGQTAAVAFELTQPLTDVSIFADLTCFGCDGGVFLTTAIGPLAQLSDIVDAVNFGPGSPTLLFSGLSLSAGLYFLVAATDAGLLIWNGSSAPVVSTAAGVVHHIDFFAEPREPLPTQSDFEVVFDRSAFYHIDAKEVPEPVSVLLFGAGLLSAVGVRMRRRR